MVIFRSKLIESNGSLFVYFSQVYFCNPEAFLEKEEAKSLRQNTEFEERVGCIVFDEVHTAVSW